MNNKQSLISAAMLEALWSSRQKDMIDLITPFILYAVAKNTSPGEKINTKVVLDYVRENYAYPDLPEAIVKKALSRIPNSTIDRKDGKFYLVKPIDDNVERIDKRQKECDECITQIGKELYPYLISHCKKSKIKSEDHAIELFHSFFARYGLEVGTDDLASTEIKPEEYETDYYIARFIYECKEKHNSLYNSIIDLVKGYYLRLAIYIQPENGDIKTASFINTIFILDTPVLIDLLGYQGVERKENAVALIKMLQKQKAKLYYFPHIIQEIIDILTAYKYSLIADTKNIGTKTLDGLNQLGYTVSDVEREISLLESKLEHNYKIKKHELPEYITIDGNIVDKSQIVLDEIQLKEFIRENTPHYSEDNLDNDIASVLAIHRLREGSQAKTLESSKAVFITNNTDFIRAFRKYYRTNVDNETIDLALSVSNLSAIVWIKCGEVAPLSETELLKNAYCAMQPIPEILTKIEEILMKLREDGIVKPEQVLVLRASRVFQNDLWTKSFGDVKAITDISVIQAKKTYEQSLIEDEARKHGDEISELKELHKEEVESLKDIIEEKTESFNKKVVEIEDKYSVDLLQQKKDEREKEKQRKEKATKQAMKYAENAKNEWLKPRLKILNRVCITLIFLSIIGLFISISINSSIWVLIISFSIFIVSAISAYDTVLGKKKLIIRWLNKKANEYETKILEEKKNEYMNIILDNEE